MGLIPAQLANAVVPQNYFDILDFLIDLQRSIWVTTLYVLGWKENRYVFLTKSSYLEWILLTNCKCSIIVDERRIFLRLFKQHASPRDFKDTYRPLLFNYFCTVQVTLQKKGTSENPAVTNNDVAPASASSIAGFTVTWEMKVLPIWFSFKIKPTLQWAPRRAMELSSKYYPIFKVKFALYVHLFNIYRASYYNLRSAKFEPSYIN